MYARIAVIILLLVAGFELSIIIHQNGVIQQQRVLLWEMIEQVEASLVPCHNGNPLPRIEWFNAEPIQSVSGNQHTDRGSVAGSALSKLVYSRNIQAVAKYPNQAKADTGR